jgi:hypothetical protein
MRCSYFTTSLSPRGALLKILLFFGSPEALVVPVSPRLLLKSVIFGLIFETDASYSVFEIAILWTKIMTLK